MSVSGLHQIGYVSVRMPEVDDDQIVDDIALPAYRKNRDLGITGCLWFDKQYFVQFIEGEEQNLQGLYASICRDARHCHVREIVNRPIETRVFERFAMRVIRDENIDPVRNLISIVFGEDEFPPLAQDISLVLEAADGAMHRLIQD